MPRAKKTREITSKQFTTLKIKVLLKWQFVQPPIKKGEGGGLLKLSIINGLAISAAQVINTFPDMLPSFLTLSPAIMLEKETK